MYLVTIFTFVYIKHEPSYRLNEMLILSNFILLNQEVAQAKKRASLPCYVKCKPLSMIHRRHRNLMLTAVWLIGNS